MSWIVLIMTLLILLLLKGFFSGSEIALVNSDKIKMRHLGKQGNKGAQLVLKLFQTPDLLLGTTLLGTNICTTAFATIATALTLKIFDGSGDWLAFLLVTPMLLIFGEIVPKSVYQQMSDTLAPIIVRPLSFFSFLLYPVTFVFVRIARLVTRLILGGSSEQNVYITREQLHAILEVSERGSSISAFNRNRIKKVIRFAETSVAEAMVPLADIVAIERDRATEDVIRLVRLYGFNRIPVYDDNISNIIGLVTLTTWDLMDPEVAKRELEELVQEPLYVSRYQTIDQLLPRLEKRSDHMAIVVDEFGAAAGMITMEDIIEEVVGEIDVGYDFEEYFPRARRHYEVVGEAYIMDARLPISELNDVLGASIPSAEFHTLGGYILAHLRRIPKVGEELVEDGHRFTILDANERAVLKVEVRQAFSAG